VDKSDIYIGASICHNEGSARIMSIEELRTRIEEASKKLGLDADKLLREYGVTTALAEMLERTVAEQSK